MKIIKPIILILLSIICFGFISETFQHDKIEPYVLKLPEGFPEPVIPENNQLTKERIELGRRLFYDPILSVDSSISCASCHNQSLGFADNRAISPGVEGRLAMRNAPTLTNVAYNPTLLFDGFLKTLEMQVLVPIEEHAEFANNIVEISEKLANDSLYSNLSRQAYNREIDPFVITRSISSFERTLISGNSKFDQQAYQGKNVMDRSEKRGMNLFFNELECASCHSGFNFTNFSTQNNGLYKVYTDTGRMRVTKLEQDRAMFKVPTLRNIELTAPYMHDGSIATLEEVVDHYQTGGKNHPNKSDKLKPFQLSKKEKHDLVNFLKCLTDTDFINNPDFKSPF
ncbi:MAG: cytochrome c peroxidase [Putridiphycobacter sp.]|nr:cytochrome c peroxidase [Putridiphycobacter sp.]